MKTIPYYIIVVLILFLSPLRLYSQFLVEIKKKEFKQEEEGFEQAWAELEAGDEYFSAGMGTYKDALEHYLKAHEYNALDPNLNYRLGVCHLFTDNKYKAVEYLEAAWEFNRYVSPDIHFMLARAYHLNYRFDEAIKEYAEFLSFLPPRDLKAVDVPAIEKAVTQCEYAKELLEDTLRYRIVNAGVGVNSEADDYKPVFSASRDRMFFTSRRMLGEKDLRNERDNKFNEKVFIAYSSDDSLWAPAQNIGEPVNSRLNTAALLLADNDQTLYFYQGDDLGGEIYYSIREEGEWGKPRRLRSKINSGSHESSASVTKDHQNLYFISSRQKGSQGGLDIWKSTKDEKGDWQTPVNLGPEVNSPYNEEGLYLSGDEKTLFFSSDREESMGGYDVFMSTLTDSSWSKPVNMGYPVNTPDDDLFWVPVDSVTSYLSGTREDTKGLMDIYKVVRMPEPPPPVPVDTTPETQELPEPVPVVLLPRLDPKVKIAGYVRDADDSTSVQAMIEIIDMEENRIVATTISSRSEGAYSIKLNRKDHYGVEVNAAGYMFYLDVMPVGTDTSIKEINRDFFISKIKVGEKIVLENIFFEFNKSALSPESSAELDRATEFMDKNPDLRIEISGHTDNVGSAAYNLRLSEGRAKAVVDYMVLRGIDGSRLEYAGYGFQQAIESNDTEEGRAANRRVEFKVIE